MLKRSLKPEIEYILDDKNSMEKIKKALDNNETVTGRVKSLDINGKRLIVSLGGKMNGILPFNEVTIEELKYIKNIVPIQVEELIKQRTIRCKIIAIDGKFIILSRKRNLMEVFDFLSKSTNITFKALVIGTAEFGVFCDIGDGIRALCGKEDISEIHQDPRIWVSNGFQSNAVITEISNYEHQIRISFRKAYDRKDINKFRMNQIIKVKIGDKIINDRGKITGYYCEVTPSIPGIANLIFRNDEYEIGEVVEAFIQSIDKANYRMKVSILNKV